MLLYASQCRRLTMLERLDIELNIQILCRIFHPKSIRIGLVARTIRFQIFDKK
jgi:hypothetical protein